jgi:nitronate monooxygenase
VFAPVPGPAEPSRFETYAERLAAWGRERGLEAGAPRHTDDGFAAKIDLLESEAVAAVSFAFGCPDPDVVELLHRASSEVWVTVTTPAESDLAVDAGADALVAQGAEAGGHRASFVDDDAPPLGLLPLLQLLAPRHPVPLVASGGIATGGAIAATLSAGASAAQLGTAFMRCPEAGTAQAHRDALATERPTDLTRAFTGRLGRGIRNEFMDEHGDEAPAAYPEIHYVTAPMRRAAREAGDAEAINLWGGEAHSLARAVPAGDLVRDLAAEAAQASAAAAARLVSHRL